MSGSGFSITIRAVDSTTAAFNSVNKSVAALNRTGAQLSNITHQIGKTTGITQLAGNMRTLGSAGLDAFRSLERVVAPIGLITSAGTLAGMGALTRRFAEMSVETNVAAQRIGIGVQRLSAFEGAARQAGLSAGSMSRGLASLGDTMRDAAGGRNAGALQMFQLLGVSVEDLNRAKPDEMLLKIADQIKRIYAVNPQDAARAMRAIFGGDELLPLLIQGRAAIEQRIKQSERFGTVTKEMTENGQKLNEAYTNVSQAITGTAMRLVNDMAPAITKYLTQTAEWIADNQKVADSYAKIGLAIVASFATLRGVFRLLSLIRGPGFGIGVRLLGGAGLGTAIIMTPSSTQTSEQESEIMKRAGVKPLHERFPELVVAPPGAAVPSQRVAPVNITDRMREARDYFRSHGYTEEQTAGILANLRRESNFDPSAYNPAGGGQGARGIAQWRGPRQDAFRRMFGHGLEQSTMQEQLEFIDYELKMGHERRAGIGLSRTKDPAEAYRTFYDLYERGNPETVGQRGHGQGVAEDIFRQFNGQPVTSAPGPGVVVPGPASGSGGSSGRVQVDINLHGAPAGTTATSRTTGAVIAPPPRIATPMPNYGNHP